MSMNVSSVSTPSTSTPVIWSGASRAMPPTQKMTALFDSIDTSGSGTITPQQFDQAFATKNPPAGFKAMGADAIFNAIAPAGSNSVSKQDFVQGMTSLMSKVHGHHGGHHHHGGGAAQPSQSVSSSLDALTALPGSSSAPGSILDVAA